MKMYKVISSLIFSLVISTTARAVVPESNHHLIWGPHAFDIGAFSSDLPGICGYFTVPRINLFMDGNPGLCTAATLRADLIDGAGVVSYTAHAGGDVVAEVYDSAYQAERDAKLAFYMDQSQNNKKYYYLLNGQWCFGLYARTTQLTSRQGYVYEIVAMQPLARRWSNTFLWDTPKVDTYHSISFVATSSDNGSGIENFMSAASFYYTTTVNLQQVTQDFSPLMQGLVYGSYPGGGALPDFYAHTVHSVYNDQTSPIVQLTTQIMPGVSLFPYVMDTAPAHQATQQGAIDYSTNPPSVKGEVTILFSESLHDSVQNSSASGHVSLTNATMPADYFSAYDQPNPHWDNPTIGSHSGIKLGYSAPMGTSVIVTVPSSGNCVDTLDGPKYLYGGRANYIFFFTTATN